MSDAEFVSAAAAFGSVCACAAKALVSQLSAPIISISASPAASAGLAGGFAVLKTGAPVLLVAKTTAGAAALFFGAGLTGAVVAGGMAFALVKALK